MATTFQVFIYTIINLIHGIIEIYAHYWFTIINMFSTKKIPPIKNPLLFESMVSLALKIRTKQVSYILFLIFTVEKLFAIFTMKNKL